MAHRKTERDPLFAGRWFEDDIILLCLRWYFRFKLSYRDLVEILGERGLSILHSTILRWVVRYADTCEKRWRRFERPVGIVTLIVLGRKGPHGFPFRRPNSHFPIH